MHTFSSKKSIVKNFFKCIANCLTPNEHSYKKWEKKNKFLRKAGINIGKNVAIDHGFLCLTGQEENLDIGDYSALGIGTKVYNFNSVKIGKFCMFAADVTLVNGGHETNTFEPFSAELRIGNGCWFGNGARVVGGVTIGNNAIIGAGALVLNDVPDNAVVVGVPAKVIKFRDLPKRVWHLGGDYFDPVNFELLSDERQKGD